jgi:protein-tyrosine phosphatase
MATRRAGETEVHAINEFRGRIPSLPPVKSVNAELYMGPTEESNWVIYGHLLVGAYPSSTNDLANAQLLTSILRLGVTTFVCLQQEYQHEGVTESQWRSGEKLRPYIFDAIRLVDALPDSFFTTTTVRGLIPRGKPDGLEFVHFPIVDCSIANDASVLQLCHDLSQRLLKGEVMYLHCWGGHGRTGTVVSIMLGLLYGLSPLDAMRWVQFCHDLRVAPMGTASPQTETQRQQVIRVLNAVRQAQIVHSGVSSGAGASGYSTSSHSNNNNNNGELSRHSPRTLLSPQPAVSGARSGSLSMALPQNKQHALIPADATSSAVLSTGPNTDNSNGSSSSSSSSSGNNNNTFQKNSDQPQRASAAALAAASMPRTAQTAQPKPRSGSVPLRIQSQVNNVSSARAPVASWQSGTKINNGNTNANNQASTRIRRLSSAQQEQGQGSSTSSSSPSQPSHPSPQASVGYATSPGKNNTAAHGSNHGPRVSSASSSSSSSMAAPATAMSHLSPRPDAVAASALGNGAAGSPTSVREAILTDPRATAVAPLASSTATVLGLGPLLAANRSSLVFSSSSSSTATTSSSSSINSSGQQSRGGGGASSLSTNRENPTLRPGVQQSTTEGKTSDDNGNNNGVIEGVGGGGGGVDLPLQQQLRPSSADAAIFSRRGNNNNNSSNTSGAISGNSNPVIAQSNVINYDSSSNISSSGVDRDKSSVSNSQQTNDSTVNPLSTSSDSTTNDKVPASATSPQAQFKAGPTISRPTPGGTMQSSTASSSSQQQQGSTTTAASTSTMMTSSPRSIGGYSTRASGYAAALAQQQANTGSPTRGGGGGGGGYSYNQQGGGATISSPPPQRSSAAAAGLASAIAAYSTSLTGGAATSPGQGASQGGRSRLAVARQQSREPHTISSTVSGVNNYGSSTTTTESINGLANVVSPLSASTSTTAARNALFRSPAPPLEAVTSSSSSSLPSNMSPSSYRPNTSSPSSSSSGAGLAAAASINAAAALSAQNSAGRPRVRIVVRGGEPST